GADLATDGTIGVDCADAGDDGLLVDVQTGAAGMQDLQGSDSGVKTRPGRWDDLRGQEQFPLRALPGTGRRPGGVRHESSRGRDHVRLRAERTKATDASPPKPGPHRG